MKSVNSCVQDFITHHSPALFPSDSTTDVRRPRLNRLNSISSTTVNIEDEDPNLFVITPPIEYFLDVSSRLRREQFFKLVRPGHLLICNVLTASSRDILARILCFDDGHRRALHDLKLTATCLLNTSSSKNISSYRKKPKYDRDVQEVSDDDKDDGEYQSGDMIRACVSHVDIHKEEIQLTLDSSLTQHHPSCKRLGIINEDDLPKHYILLRRQEEQSQSYEDILQTSKALNNRACVQTLYQRLKDRFDYFHTDEEKMESSNDILHMTLVNSFKKKQITSDDYFDKLRQKQDHAWAMESVAHGVRLMKENDFDSAVLHFNKALSTDPKCVDAFVARGALSANQGHFKRAMQDFEDALKIDHKHTNALKYLYDVLNNLANDTDDYDTAIYYLEKALKYKSDDSEIKRKLDGLRTKKKETTRKLEYGPSLPSTLQSSSKDKRYSRSPKRRHSTVKGSSSSDRHSKRKRPSASPSSSSSSSSSSSRSTSSSSSSSSTTTSDSLTTISSSSVSDSLETKKTKDIPIIDITGSDKSTTTRTSSQRVSNDNIHQTERQSSLNENNKNGNSLTRESIISNISRSYTNDHCSKEKQINEQRKTLPSTNVSSSSNKQQHESSSSTKKNRSVVMDREAEDIEKLYIQLKAKKSMEKQKK